MPTGFWTRWVLHLFGGNVRSRLCKFCKRPRCSSSLARMETSQSRLVLVKRERECLPVISISPSCIKLSAKLHSYRNAAKCLSFEIFILHWHYLFLDCTFRMRSAVARSCHARTRFIGSAPLQWYKTACKYTWNVAIFPGGEVSAWSFKIFFCRGLKGLIIKAGEGLLGRST